MENLLKDLADNEEVVGGEGADQRRQMLYNMENKCEVPSEYGRFLQSFNGVWYDGANLFGLNPEAVLHDLATENNSLAVPGMLVLGYDEFDYLAYDHKNKNYVILNREDLQPLEIFYDLAPAIRRLLKL